MFEPTVFKLMTMSASPEELPEVATEFSTLPLLMSILLGLKLLEGAVLLTARSPET